MMLSCRPPTSSPSGEDLLDVISRFRKWMFNVFVKGVNEVVTVECFRRTDEEYSIIAAFSYNLVSSVTQRLLTKLILVSSGYEKRSPVMPSFAKWSRSATTEAIMKSEMASFLSSNPVPVRGAGYVRYSRCRT